MHSEKGRAETMGSGRLTGAGRTSAGLTDEESGGSKVPFSILPNEVKIEKLRSAVLSLAEEVRYHAAGIKALAGDVRGYRVHSHDRLGRPVRPVQAGGMKDAATPSNDRFKRVVEQLD